MSAGFLDAAAARAAARRLKLRERFYRLGDLQAALMDRLDQASKADRDQVTALIERGIELAARDVQRSIGGQAINLVEGQHVREDELLQGMDLVLKLLDALLDGIGHGLFSTNVQTGAEPKPPVNAAHRLCEGAN